MDSPKQQTTIHIPLQESEHEQDKVISSKKEECDKSNDHQEVKKDEEDEDQDKPQRLKHRHGHGERGRSGRRESIFYRSSFGENDHSPLSISRKVSLASENLPEEQLITPFAQILQSLKYARRNFLLLSGHFLVSSSANEIVRAKSSGSGELTDSEATRVSTDTLEDLDWSIRQLERVHSRRSVTDMTTFKFKKILSRELNQFSETGSSASEVSDFLNSTFLDDKNKDFTEANSESDGVSGDMTSSSCSHATLKQDGDMFPLPEKNNFRVFSKRKNSAPSFLNIKGGISKSFRKSLTKPYILRVNLKDHKFNLFHSYWSKLGQINKDESNGDGGYGDGGCGDGNKIGSGGVDGSGVDREGGGGETSNNNKNNKNKKNNSNGYDEDEKINKNINNKKINNSNRYAIMNDNEINESVDGIVNKADCEGLFELMRSVDDWDFDVFHLSDLTNQSPLLFLTSYIFYKNNWLDFLGIDACILLNFLNSIEHNYNNNNPYHNNLHAADVVQASWSLVGRTALKGLLSPMELIATVVAAAVHDVDHPGLTNQFLINSETDLALLYNDRSILENHHASVAFSILRLDDCNIFKNLSRGVYKAARRMIIDMVLATDMSLHLKLVADLKTAIETQKVINVGQQQGQQLQQQGQATQQQSQGQETQQKQQLTTQKSQSSPSQSTLQNNFQSKGLLDLTNVEDTIQILQTLIHCADLGNPTRKLPLYAQWVEKIMLEFKEQGDMEREKGLDVSPMCGREVDVNKAQVGFIDYIVLPLWEAWDELMNNQCVCLLDNLSFNREYYSRGDKGGSG